MGVRGWNGNRGKGSLWDVTRRTTATATRPERALGVELAIRSIIEHPEIEGPKAPFNLLLHAKYLLFSDANYIYMVRRGF